MDNKMSIKCTAIDSDEKAEIKRIFKENSINLSGFVMNALRNKAYELKSSK